MDEWRAGGSTEGGEEVELEEAPIQSEEGFLYTFIHIDGFLLFGDVNYGSLLVKFALCLEDFEEEDREVGIKRYLVDHCQSKNQVLEWMCVIIVLRTKIKPFHTFTTFAWR